MRYKLLAPTKKTQTQRWSRTSNPAAFVADTSHTNKKKQKKQTNKQKKPQK